MNDINYSRVLRLSVLLPLIFFQFACSSTDKRPDIYQLVSDADNAYRISEYTRAEMLYRKITQVMPEDANAFFRLGNIYARQNKPEMAINSYREAILRDSGQAKYFNNLAVVFLMQAEHALTLASEKAKPGEQFQHWTRNTLKKVSRINNR